MIDLLTLFMMLFCAGFQQAPSLYTCTDDNGQVIDITITDQQKQDYYEWYNNAGYKDPGLKDELAAQ